MRRKDVHTNYILFFWLQAAKNLDLNIVVVVLSLQMSTGTVFLYCYAGSLTTSQFLRYGNISYESDWVEMPIELRKFIQILIADAQRPLIFRGLNLVDLNLAAFTKVNLIQCNLSKNSDKLSFANQSGSENRSQLLHDD